MITCESQQTIERESRETRAVWVRLLEDDGTLTDPTAFTAEVAFAPIGTRPTTWFSAIWEPGPITDAPIGSAYAASYDVGGTNTGAAIELDPGRYVAYVRVTSPSEVVVLETGTLVVK